MTIRPFLLTQTMNGETFTRPVSSDVAAIYLEAAATMHGQEPDQAVKDTAEALTHLLELREDLANDLPAASILGTLEDGRTFRLTTPPILTPVLASESTTL
jgi:hypothetical protein